MRYELADRKVFTYLLVAPTIEVYYMILCWTIYAQNFRRHLMFAIQKKVEDIMADPVLMYNPSEGKWKTVARESL